jgi:uncharacterized repeat protein (TIGR03803 family)
VQGTDGNFYGTTSGGGAAIAGIDGGTVYKLTASGKLTTLYSFCSQPDCTDGYLPQANLVQATDGNFYGTTVGGGIKGGGTVFKITRTGKLTTLYSFCSIFQGACTDGDEPTAGVVQATDGNFYGTTELGGVNNSGTVFKITPGGKLTTLYSFCSILSAGYCADGEYPEAGLLQATDGNLYGTTYRGGTDNGGTIFEITPQGALTTLYSLSPDTTDGIVYGGVYPLAGLLQATNGSFYGTTDEAGYGGGALFTLAAGLGPFVQTLPTSGKVATAVKILGNNLTSTTNVTFNGVPATFKVVASSEITTTVPIGATTGNVVVTTPSGTLNSNVSFRVTPTISGLSPTSGPIGTSVVITGQSLTGATTVTFGGVKATSFTVNSDSQVTATVPTGAKTGKVVVITPGGAVSSVETFTVTM